MIHDHHPGEATIRFNSSIKIAHSDEWQWLAVMMDITHTTGTRSWIVFSGAMTARTRASCRLARAGWCGSREAVSRGGARRRWRARVRSSLGSVPAPMVCQAARTARPGCVPGRAQPSSSPWAHLGVWASADERAAGDQNDRESAPPAPSRIEATSPPQAGRGRSTHLTVTTAPATRRAVRTIIRRAHGPGGAQRLRPGQDPLAAGYSYPGWRRTCWRDRTDISCLPSRPGGEAVTGRGRPSQLRARQAPGAGGRARRQGPQVVASVWVRVMAWPAWVRRPTRSRELTAGRRWRGSICRGVVIRCAPG